MFWALEAYDMSRWKKALSYIMGGAQQGSLQLALIGNFTSRA